jgi:hypothetical protein
MQRWLSTRFVVRLPSAEIPVAILVIAGFVAFVITGFYDFRHASLFGQNFGDRYVLQPVPIYTFFSLLLLALQVRISEGRSLRHVLYLLITSTFALVYSGVITFSTGNGPQIQGPLSGLVNNSNTYVIINFVLIAVFIVDAVLRHTQRRANTNGAGDQTAHNSPSFISLSADCAGLALLCLFMWVVLSLFEHPETVLPLLAIFRISQPAQLFRIVVELPGHPFGIIFLKDLDLGIAFLAGVLSLLFLVMVGLLVDIFRFRAQLGRFLRGLGTQVFVSLRLVLSPLVWFIPAFLIALFSLELGTYYASVRPARGYWDLLNPFTGDLLEYAQVVAGLVLVAVAVACVVAAVAIVEQDVEIVNDTIHTLGTAGLRVAVTFVFFIYSLALFNAFLFLLDPASPTPFRVGTAGLIAIVTAVLAFVVSAIVRARVQKPPVHDQPDSEPEPVGAGVARGSGQRDAEPGGVS